MIRLRLEVLESEAEELGWPPRLRHGRFDSIESGENNFGRSYRPGKTYQTPPTRKPTEAISKGDPSEEYHLLKNSDNDRDQALLNLDALHKSRVKIGADILRLKSEGAKSADIEKWEAGLAQIIRRMTAIEKEYEIGKLDPLAVIKARQRVIRRQGKENELLNYKGRVENDAGQENNVVK